MTSIFIRTFGCSLNQSDSEGMAGLLARAKFEIVATAEESDLIIVNTCTVKEPTQFKFFSFLHELKKSGKPIVVAGCIPQTTPELLEDVSMIGPHNIHEIVSVVEETVNGNCVTLIAEGKCDRLALPRIRKNPAVEIIPICEGCLGNCSYCIVKRARGNLQSYARDKILANARKALSEGVKEIWLTAQDTGCYGKDIGSTLPMLVKEIVRLDFDFKIRLGMMNPEHLKEFLPALVELLKNPKVFRFIHIPVQSGNNDILKSMKRNYNVEDFVSIVSDLKDEIPNLTISTDFICGFPGETKEQFLDSLNLMKKLKPDVVNISRYWSRPKTPAAAMDQVADQEKKDRSTAMAAAHAWIAFENNRRWRGWSGKVIVDEPGKDNTWVGRNYAYKPVILQGKHHIGQVVDARIIDSTKDDLRAG